MLLRPNIYFAAYIPRRIAGFLQKRHIRIHPQQLTPRLMPLGDVPTHNFDQCVPRSGNVIDSLAS